MSLATLFNVPLDERTFSFFSFANMDSHLRIVAAIQARDGIGLFVPILDPINFNAFETFLFNHQATHNDMNAVLGISGLDLSDVDPSNKEAMASFVWNHALEHREAENQLRIG